MFLDDIKAQIKAINCNDCSLQQLAVIMHMRMMSNQDAKDSINTILLNASSVKKKT